MARAPGTPWGLLERLRYQSHSGRVIRRHRALHRLEFRRASLLHPLVLLIGSYLALWAGADLITVFWSWEFGFWLRHLELPATLETQIAGRGGTVHFAPHFTGPTRGAARTFRPGSRRRAAGFVATGARRFCAA